MLGRKEGWELIEETTPGGNADRFFSGQLEFIESPEMLRTVAKTVYTALALRMGADFAMRLAFLGQRRLLFVSSAQRPTRTGLPSHSINAY
jgi:hypothetical protein